MRWLLVLLALGAFSFLSCNEKVVEKPEEPISEEMMVDILYDITLISAARNTNSDTLVKYGVETMDFIQRKYGVDSLRFVSNEAYYASMPVAHEAIYMAVDDRLGELVKQQEELQRIQDSIKLEATKPKKKTPKPQG